VVFSRLATELSRITTVKTNIYIDGYNLYYSRLKETPYKWLDVVELFSEQLARSVEPASELLALKYFTAPIKAKYARHGQASEHAQTQYLRALQARHAEKIEIIQGFHVFEPAYLPTHISGQLPSKAALSPVWKIEEKQTDVNLALHAYRDALSGQVEQVVLCSNDSDLELCLKFIRQDCPQVKIGLVMPLRPSIKGSAVPNKRLTALAHWVRHGIRDEELEAAQMPPHVNTRKKPASKPPHW
jgi:uncharacterized LabA/DUF88 family protein